AGMYEIDRELGSGGGGIAYLGWHTRLNKQIVLKADKGKLSTSEESRRREVDMLKNLSHTYIPQVYDYVEEKGVVYTVMDFIDGESMDKMLARGEKASQPQVIRWACQLLEALYYLHSQPPHGILHGDIKPANIMLRPNGNICLIDYNIALALGENGTEKVGFSRGYASPEHYGADYLASQGLSISGFTTAHSRAFGEVRSRENIVGTKNVSSAEDRTSANEEETLADTDRTLADGEETLSDADRTLTDSEKTLPDGDKTLADGDGMRASFLSAQGSKYVYSEKQVVLLDVRSDIYCLGATLYHLISGKKPDQNALRVKPLGEDVCSPAVAAIIAKAMAPQADERYQTAQEMLNAFMQLHRQDRRVLQRKKRESFCAILLTMMFLAGGALTFVGQKQLQQRENALVLAEYSADALAQGNVSEAISLALSAIPSGSSILDAPVTAQAQYALSNALNIYDLSEGFKAVDMLELPGAPFGMRASPEGTYLAVIYAYEMAVYRMEDLRQVIVLPVLESALSDVAFVNETQLLYAGADGITLYDLEKLEALWTGETATSIALSGDGTVAVVVDRDASEAVAYSIADGSVITHLDFGELHQSVAVNDIFADPEDDIFTLNENGTLLAVSFSNGSVVIFDLEDSERDMILYEESEYTSFSGGFSGQYFAYVAAGDNGSVFGLVDTDQAAFVGGYEQTDSFLLQTDETGIYLASGNVLIKFDAESLSETELAYTGDVNIVSFAVKDGYALTATDDARFSFYDSGANLMSTESGTQNFDFTLLAGDYAAVGNRSETSVRILCLEDFDDALLLSYDARYDHDEARLSQDLSKVMLFGYQGFRIYTLEGEMVAQVELPDADYIYDQQFRRNADISYLEVIWYDGTVRCYSAVDGKLISESVEEAPSADLYEEFYTDQYVIASELHSAPMVYRRSDGKEVAVLESDDYLTYVTQTGEMLITEYVTASGERYGLLLDSNFETLAYLPNLCDVLDDLLFFDYESGNIRQCRLYSLQEMIALGEAYFE
ncbi:MAG: WD40 repeat domain-containing serine/threonine protein kinase, partial [Lachnospiraceae bacterium]|nr:WD40 repeat domain-containing serine/threonine protein kinase [Lachnospiraceae bacterium]